MTISVIIPIFNAEKYLPVLFDSLDANEFIDGDEVLLIDNGSTDNSVKICEAKVAEIPGLYRLLHYTEKAGSYAARNYGVREAKGQALVFTDSDTRPVKDWIMSIRTNLQPGKAIAGKIQLEIVNNGLWELYDNLVHLNSEKNAINGEVATANMAVLRTDFERIGFFEERFSGGDYDWSIRAQGAGLSVVFLNDAKVYHPTRKTFEQIIKKEQRIAYGAGNHFRINNKSFMVLVLKYSAKIFKIDTGIKNHMALKQLGVSKSELHEFDRKFLVIRISQLKYAIRGYLFTDARKLDIK